MKYITYLGVISTLLFVPIFSGCEKEEGPQDTDLPNSNFTVYTNESGVPNEEANALQANYSDELTGDVIDFYGNYDVDGSPLQVQTIRVNQSNSDTIINFIINPITNSFEKAILEVNGTRLETMVSFDFPEGDTSMVMSYYNVNWNSGESELIYSSELFLTNGTIVEQPIFYQARLAGLQDGGTFVGLLAGVGTGIAVAETALAVGAIGGSSLVGTAAGAVAVGVAAVGSSVIIGAVVVGATLFAITSNANASEPMPPGTPLPPGTPQSNPTPNPEPQIPTPVNPCLANGVSVTVGVDPGNELVAIATGGTGGPYTFSWSTGATTTAGTFTTLTPGEPGIYTVSVVDGNGCAAAGSATIEDGVVQCELCATNFGEYSWSNGSSSSCITVDEPGTYTVTVNDTLLPQPINEQFTVLGVVGSLECPE